MERDPRDPTDRFELECLLPLDREPTERELDRTLLLEAFKSAYSTSSSYLCEREPDLDPDLDRPPDLDREADLDLALACDGNGSILPSSSSDE